MSEKSDIKMGAVPGFEELVITNGANYEYEKISVENSLSNGLRIVVRDEEDAASFHIRTLEVAELIAEKLQEFSKRIGNPPQ